MNPEPVLTLALTLLVVALTVALTPLFIQLRRTLKKAEGLLSRLEEELPAAIKKLGNSADELASLAESLNHRLTGLDQAISRARVAGDHLADTGAMIKRALAPWVIQAGSIGTGIRAFLDVIGRGRRKKDQREE